MYQPVQFKAQDPALAATLIRENPFASLVTSDDEGLPTVTHLPLHLEERQPRWVLHGHVARANPQARHLASRSRAVVTFLGPHAYLSPKVYPDLQRVPSWNYVAVHCTVQARLLDDAQAKDALLKRLIADHEPAYAQQWRELPQEYTGRLLSAISAFELEVVDLQCTLKLNQHRRESHAALRAAYAQGGEQERALVRWMDRLGMGV